MLGGPVWRNPRCADDALHEVGGRRKNFLLGARRRVDAIARKKHMRLTWRKQKNETGLARVVQSPRGYDLCLGGVSIISVRPCFNWPSRDIAGWYFYGMGTNTARRPKPTMEEAKEEAKKYFLEHT